MRKNSELRKDPVDGRWVIIATERDKRPSDFRTPPGAPEPIDSCPFCEGNEHRTPPEIMAVRPGGGPPDSPGWSVRVIPNKYPALRMKGRRNQRRAGLSETMTGLGAHEVVIESPVHRLGLEQLSVEQIVRVIDVYVRRVRDLNRNVRLRYALVFKNKGREAGASLEHTHTQIMATPILPATMGRELEQSSQYYGHHGRCVFCDLIAQEEKAAERIVSSTNRFVALSPFASRFPFETWILPRGHQSAFDRLSGEELQPLAITVKDVLLRLRAVLKDPAYNFVIHTAPLREAELNHYHWHIEVMPRLAIVAGFEWGTGFYINPMPPEGAARQLREAVITAGNEDSIA